MRLNHMKFALVLVGVFFVACGEAGDAGETTAPPSTMVETTEEDTVPEHDGEFAPVVGQSRADLAVRLDVEELSIEVISSQAVTWRDGSLGCPQPGMMYTQALVEGSRVVLEHDERFYDYHAGVDDDPFLCESDAEDGGHDSVPPLEK
ncbi:MAG TPA: hypothetical protein VMM81_08330 [Acidimicrobiia bacterium]|nr:hypothetical protein [Acidimicrobiia bacterium]